MVRDIRTGHGYVCGGTLPISSNPTDCTSTGAPSIAFYDADNNPVQYYWGVNPCDSANTQQQIYKWENNAVCPIAITAPEVTIQSMTFYVSGTSIVAHDHQPKVLLTIKGFAGTGKNQSSFNIQTFISQRLLNTP